MNVQGKMNNRSKWSSLILILVNIINTQKKDIEVSFNVDEFFDVLGNLTIVSIYYYLFEYISCGLFLFFFGFILRMAWVGVWFLKLGSE